MTRTQDATALADIADEMKREISFYVSSYGHHDLMVRAEAALRLAALRAAPQTPDTAGPMLADAELDAVCCKGNAPESECACMHPDWKERLIAKITPSASALPSPKAAGDDLVARSEMIEALADQRRTAGTLYDELAAELKRVRQVAKAEIERLQAPPSSDARAAVIEAREATFRECAAIARRYDDCGALFIAEKFDEAAALSQAPATDGAGSSHTRPDRGAGA